MENQSLLNTLKDMIKILENSLIDGEKLVHKGNSTAGKRVRENMQQIKKIALDVRFMVQRIKKTNKE